MQDLPYRGRSQPRKHVLYRSSRIYGRVPPTHPPAIMSCIVRGLGIVLPWNIYGWLESVICPSCRNASTSSWIFFFFFCRRRRRRRQGQPSSAPAIPHCSTTTAVAWDHGCHGQFFFFMALCIYRAGCQSVVNNPVTCRNFLEEPLCFK